MARERTKLHEEIARGTLQELAARYRGQKVKGELVLIIGRSTNDAQRHPPDLTLAERIEQLEADGLDHKAALKKAAKEFGLRKSEAYRRVNDL